MPAIDKAIVRMYRMGTGDCFVVKFYSGEQEQFKMMIDGGTWQGIPEHISKYITNLKEYVNNQVDLLVVTHEHKDHVHAFGVCEELFTSDFEVGEIWMGWTEDDSVPKVKQWQKDYGDKKKAFGLAAQRLGAMIQDPAFVSQTTSQHDGPAMIAAKQQFSQKVNEFADLHFDIADGYIGPLKGMSVVKTKINKKKIRYFKPGDVIGDIEKLEGIRIFVLGPPLSWEETKKQDGGKGESYDHNKELAESDAFAAAVLNGGDSFNTDVLPFDEKYVTGDMSKRQPSDYSNTDNSWRNIDFDWYQGAGSLGMRISSITNNLSLVLAIEFVKSGRVMLFPGDAEYGSWASWHTIDWAAQGRNKNFTENILNRTVFYKVAHHLSHNGTAKKLGMEMMTHPDLAAMATLDYSIISSGWKGTMPNKGLLKDLVRQTKGRLMVMNTDDLFFDPGDTRSLKDEIDDVRQTMGSADAAKFNDSFREDPLFLEFIVNA